MVTRLPIDTLVIEQEAAIDAIFRQMADVITEQGVVTPAGTIDAAATMRVVRREIALRFGGSRQRALASEIGSLIIDYTNAGRVQALRESLSVRSKLSTPQAVAERIVADRVNLPATARRLDLTTPNLIADAAPTGTIRAPRSYADRIGTADKRTVVRGATKQAPKIESAVYREAAIKETRQAYTRILEGKQAPRWWRGRYEATQPTMSSAVSSDAFFNLRPESLQAVKLDALRSPARVAEIVKTKQVPLALNDATRWIDGGGYKLSDRIWEAGEDVRLAIERRIRAGAAKGESFEKVARDLEQYLTADVKLKRLPNGRVAPDQLPGAVTKKTFGRGKGSWPARRLARTELKRAHGEMLKDAARSSDGTLLLRWSLSPRHAQPDECDDNTRRSSPGRPAGVYDWDDTPEYPNHPACLCSLALTDDRGRRF